MKKTLSLCLCVPALALNLVCVIKKPEMLWQRPFHQYLTTCSQVSGICQHLMRRRHKFKHLITQVKHNTKQWFQAYNSQPRAGGCVWTHKKFRERLHSVDPSFRLMRNLFCGAVALIWDHFFNTSKRESQCLDRGETHISFVYRSSALLRLCATCECVQLFHCCTNGTQRPQCLWSRRGQIKN